jgi:hypothetical protein
LQILAYLGNNFHKLTAHAKELKYSKLFHWVFISHYQKFFSAFIYLIHLDGLEKLAIDQGLIIRTWATVDNIVNNQLHTYELQKQKSLIKI